jgi:hypothetical protein
MIEKLSFNGDWYLPNEPENKASGILTFEQGKDIELQFHNYSPLKLEGIIDIILGESYNGALLTLVRSSAFSWRAGGVKKISSSYLIKGAHFKSLEEIVFNELQVCYNNLKPFMMISGIKSENGFPHIKNVVYEKPEAITFEIDELVSGEIDFFQTYSINPHKVHINDESIFVVKSKEKELYFEDLIEYLYKFQHFLALAAQSATYPYSISLRGKHDISLHYQISSVRPLDEALEMGDFYFIYPMIEKVFKTSIKKWFDAYNDIESIILLYMGELYAHDRRVNSNRFLNIVSALESFHRIRRPLEMKKINPSDYEKIREEIILNVPDKHHEFLNVLLDHGNQISLHERLESLIKEFNTKIFSNVFTDSSAFIKKTKDTRNYYTHFDPKGKSKILKGTELTNYYFKLKIFLLTILLQEIGFDKQLVESIRIR